MNLKAGLAKCKKDVNVKMIKVSKITLAIEIYLFIYYSFINLKFIY